MRRVSASCRDRTCSTRKKCCTVRSRRSRITRHRSRVVTFSSKVGLQRLNPQESPIRTDKKRRLTSAPCARLGVIRSDCCHRPGADGLVFRACDTKKLYREGRAVNSLFTGPPARGPTSGDPKREARQNGLVQPELLNLSLALIQGDSCDRRREADRAGVADVGLPEARAQAPKLRLKCLPVGICGTRSTFGSADDTDRRLS